MRWIRRSSAKALASHNGRPETASAFGSMTRCHAARETSAGMACRLDAGFLSCRSTNENIGEGCHDTTRALEFAYDRSFATGSQESCWRSRIGEGADRLCEPEHSVPVIVRRQGERLLSKPWARRRADSSRSSAGDHGAGDQRGGLLHEHRLQFAGGHARSPRSRGVVEHGGARSLL